VTPFRGVGGRLALALLAVVFGVLAIVYLIVVPSYRSSLANNELRGLSTSLRSIVPSFPAEPYLKQSFASNAQPKVNARVVVYDLQNITPALLEPVADSNLDTDSSDVENDPVAFDAIRKQTLARGLVTRSGQTYAEVAYPVGASVVLLQSSLHDQLQVVSVVRRRVFEAGAIATVFAILLGYGGASLFARRIRRLEYAADRIASGSFDEPVVDHGSDELGQLARSFERMRLRLSHLDRARGEFIANASHELRTPLFSLGGFLELLDDPSLDEATRAEFLGQTREQVTRLTKLATDLLDLSRIDAGRLSVVSETIDLSELADELALEFRARAAGVDHPLELAPEPPVHAVGDAERVLQVGRILVENALVHTPAATTVRISTAVDGSRATLTVANDGPGIPPGAEQQVFERFSRLEGAKASGSGLGLAIGRELAELMGGRIELDSQNGWTLFTLALTADGFT
jgi:signal transduction histidine kinase